VSEIINGDSIFYQVTAVDEITSLPYLVSRIDHQGLDNQAEIPSIFDIWRYYLSAADGKLSDVYRYSKRPIGRHQRPRQWR
jgi:hypothetical protein